MKKLDLPLKRLSLASFVAAASLGIFSLLAWFFGLLTLVSINPHYIPIAPSTAVCFVIISISSLFCVQHPANPARCRAAAVGASFVFLICLILLVSSLLGTNIQIDNWGLQERGVVESFPIGHMSPVTAGLFLMLTSGALCLYLSNEENQHLRNIAAFLAVAVVAIASIFILGYLHGTPLLYTGNTIPVAFLTALAFEFAGLGLITAAGPHVLPVRVFTGSTVRSQLIRAFLPTMTLFVLIESLIYKNTIVKTTNPALISALLSIISIIIVGILVSRKAELIGGDIDRAHAERDRAEEEREILISALQRSNTELEQFAYVASHDLQEPLRMVASYVQLLDKKYKGKLDDKADRFINYAVEGSLRMQKLIEGLLAYSRISRRGAEFSPVDIDDVFLKVVANLKTQIEENQAVITKDELPTVSGDETQLLQMLQNLVSNAIKFRRVDVPPVVHVSSKRAGMEWVISVSDNGMGIEPAYYDRIFLIFQRLHTRDKYPGTGIGLALCKLIAERHHGRIWVESVPGKGSIFFVYIATGGGK